MTTGVRAVRVLHVIQQLSAGGAARAAIAQASGGIGRGDAHALLSLVAPDARGAALAHAAGVPLLQGADRGLAEAAAADVVQVHFWNTPELYHFIASLTVPTRIVLYCPVAGDTPPHVVTRQLADWADCLVACSRYTEHVPVFAQRRHAPVPSRMVWATAGFERLRDARSRPHAHFTIGYLGTVDFAKMHPRFVALHSDPAFAGTRVLVGGSGDRFRALQQDAAALGVAARFEWRGYVDDVGAFLGECDVFGYPLRPETYAGAELVLQEAAFCGVPAVVLRQGAAAALVEHEQSGLVAEDEAGYTAAIARLVRDDGLRSRLSAGARAWATRTFSVDEVTNQLRGTYDELMVRPKRSRLFPLAGSAAQQFIEALGECGAAFRPSLESDDPGAQAVADTHISGMVEPLVSASAGGVLHYRRHSPQDPHLRLWAGLVLQAAGRRALAAAEFTAARTDPRTASRSRAALETLLRTAAPPHTL